MANNMFVAIVVAAAFFAVTAATVFSESDPRDFCGTSKQTNLPVNGQPLAFIDHKKIGEIYPEPVVDYVVNCTAKPRIRITSCTLRFNDKTNQVQNPSGRTVGVGPYPKNWGDSESFAVTNNAGTKTDKAFLRCFHWQTASVLVRKY